MKTKHTPGPWFLEENFGPKNNGILSERGRIIFMSFSAGGGLTYARHRANARLIAAAPEMLEALIQAESMLVLDGHTERNPLTNDSPILRMVRAAIAKATGGEE